MTYAEQRWTAPKVQQRVLTVLLVLTFAAISVVAARPGWVVSKISLVKDGEIAYDFDRDGRQDLIEQWEQGTLLAAREDTNADGRFDAFVVYRDGQPVKLEYDLDHDGEIDYRSVVDDGRERVEVLVNGKFVDIRKQ